MTAAMPSNRVYGPELIKVYYLRVLVVLAAAAASLVVAQDVFFSVITTNWALNGIIISVFLAGIFICFKYLYFLQCDLAALSDIDYLLFDDQDVEKLLGYNRRAYIIKDLIQSLKNSAEQAGQTSQLRPSIVRSLFNMANTDLAGRRSRMSYFVNLLIHLGLLGTFIGLAATVGSISGLISNIAAGLSGEQDLTDMLVIMIQRLEDPLAGMGMAFGTSLMGLSCSVVLGAVATSVNKADMLFSNAFSHWLFEFAMESDGFRSGSSDDSDDSRSDSSDGYGSKAAGTQGNSGLLQQHQAMLKTMDAHLQKQSAYFDQQLQVMHRLDAHLQALTASQGRQQSTLAAMSDQQQGQTEVLQAIQQGLQPLDMSRHLEALNGRGAQLMAAAEAMASELTGLQILQKEQMAQRESHGEQAFLQRDQLIKGQESSHDQLDRIDQSLERINKTAGNIPGKITGVTEEQITLAVNRLDASLVQQLKESLKKQLVSLRQFIGIDQKQQVETLQESILAAQREQGDRVVNTIEVEQKKFSALLRKFFRSSHRLYRLLFRHRD
ncbi:hypothetical protein [Endozoicomonas sp.]|uniref:hypothetical protein n=1 Tax=Endozoicomonas sp. TaxID=1892382 RepID=UPI00383A62BA